MSLIDAQEFAMNTYKCDHHGSALDGFCHGCSRAAYLREVYLLGVASRDGVPYTSEHQDKIATEIAYAEDYHQRTTGSLYGSANTAAMAVIVYLQENGFDV